jgi:hypothetical protein
MPMQRLQKTDNYNKKLVRFTPENCALIQELADASSLSFNAALNEYLRLSSQSDRPPAPRRKARRVRETATV